MSETRIFDPINRLADVLVEAGGPTYLEAVQRAEAQVAAISPRLRRALDVDVNLLLDMHDLDDAAKRARSAELSRIALRIAEVAPAIGAPETGEAARGVFAMIEAYRAEGQLRADALNLHLAAIALFEGATRLSPEETARLLQQLSEMRAAVGVLD